MKQANQWTAARRRKFNATMKAKYAAKKAAAATPKPVVQSIPLDAIPERTPSVKRAKPGNGAVQLHAEVDRHSGELCLVIGTLRVPLRLRG